MDKIICLVGESGAGKRTIAQLLEKQGLNYIQSYTTRDPKFKGERGHIFVNKIPTIVVNNKERINKKNIIAYNFVCNAHYWTTREQYKNKGTSVYVIEVKGVYELRNTIKDAQVVVIYLKSDKEMRKTRLLQRIDQIKLQTNYDKAYLETMDKIAYESEKFQVIPCDYVIDANKSINEVLRLVKKIISQ